MWHQELFMVRVGQGSFERNFLDWRVNWRQEMETDFWYLRPMGSPIFYGYAIGTSFQALKSTYPNSQPVSFFLLSRTPKIPHSPKVCTCVGTPRSENSNCMQSCAYQLFLSPTAMILLVQLEKPISNRVSLLFSFIASYLKHTYTDDHTQLSPAFSIFNGLSSLY